MTNNQIITIISDKRTSRLRYIAGLIFGERLGLHVEYAGNAQDVSNPDYCLNYSSHQMDGIASIIPDRILFEKRLQNPDISIGMDGHIPLLYANDKIELGHDPLAACFFLLSRYEEYLPHRKDEHGRFVSSSAFVSSINALQMPLVDIYVHRLRTWLTEKYPSLELKRPITEIEVTIDVDQLFMYKAKGLGRSIAGGMKDLVQNRSKFSKRLEVLLTQKRDPLDIYDSIIATCEARKIRPIFFFQVGETSRFDINNPAHLPEVKQRVSEISLDAEIGLHPSYFSSIEDGVLEKEYSRIQQLTSTTVIRSRQHYLRFVLPKTFNKLEEIGVSNEYSMGFTDANGFRAGTSVPFKFYDLASEETTNLTVHPLVFMDMVGLKTKRTLDEAKNEIKSLYDWVKRYGGVLSTVWHPEVLAGHSEYEASMDLLKFTLELTDD